MQISPDPADGRTDLFRFLRFSFAGTRPAIGREAREAAFRRVHLRETWQAIVCFSVSLVVAACVSVWMHPPDGTDTRPDAALSMPGN
jgi:hypothetical protein